MKRTFAICLALMAACSGGGALPVPSQISISSQTFDQGNVGYAFFQQLNATGGQLPYTWWVSSSGDPLPPGLTMMPDGRIAGTPTTTTTASVVVVVQDTQSQLDLVTLALEVRDVEISGATGENLVPGTQLQLQAQGGSPGYAFSFSGNQSGAQLTQNGNYTAGQTSGVDIVRATDNDGFYEEVSVAVGDNPFIGFQAKFGTTDVWWVDWDVIYDPSPTYATDFDEVLAALGLRDPASTGSQGTEADLLAKQLLMRRVMGHLSTYYGNSFDGGALPSGLAISFPSPVEPPGTTPAAGSITAAGPNKYNTICVRYGPQSSVVGTAWLDPSNDSIEHDCGDPTGTALGIFANRVLGPYLSAYNNSIQSNPVSASDVDGLTAMLYGTPPSGSRETAIFAVADNYGRVIASVLAHEIGHSLGLNHSGSSGEPASAGSGDIMNAALSISPGVTYAFNPGHWATLVSDLPGPNR